MPGAVIGLRNLPDDGKLEFIYNGEVIYTLIDQWLEMNTFYPAVSMSSVGEEVEYLGEHDVPPTGQSIETIRLEDY